MELLFILVKDNIKFKFKLKKGYSLNNLVKFQNFLNFS